MLACSGVGAEFVESLLGEEAAADVALVFGFVEFGLHGRIGVLALEQLDANLQLFRRDGDVLALGDFAENQAGFDAQLGGGALLLAVGFGGQALGVEVLLPGLAAVGDVALFFLLQ